jgi:hypothetical protein
MVEIVWLLDLQLPVQSVCQWLATGRRCFSGTPVSSSNKTDRHDITEIFLKVALHPITLALNNRQRYMINLTDLC